MIFGDLQRNIGKSTVTFRLFNDTGHSSDVEIRTCTKILETVPNPGNFTGKPPHTEAQSPPAVVKHILILHFIFPCLHLLFIFILISILVFIFFYYFIYFFCFLFNYLFNFFLLFSFSFSFVIAATMFTIPSSLQLWLFPSHGSRSSLNSNLSHGNPLLICYSTTPVDAFCVGIPQPSLLFLLFKYWPLFH